MDIKYEMMKEMEEKMGNAILLMELIQNRRLENRELSKANYGLLLDAHLSVTAAIGTLLIDKNMKQGETNESISGRLNLFASFVQGIDPCETAISEGLYTQAANLLKQQLETIAAIEEFVTGQRKDGRTPNVKFVKWDLSKVYGDLNKVAHVSDRQAFQPLFQMGSSGDTVPVSILPIYNKQISRKLYALHVSFIIQIAKLLIDLHEEIYGERPTHIEYMMLNGAMQRLTDEGFLDGNKFNDV